MPIVMTGATGKLGNLIARQLLFRLPPEELIVSVRRPDAAADLAEQGVKVRFGDYDAPDSLEVSFAGATRLLLISSSHANDAVRLRQHAAALEAAGKAGIKHLIYTSMAYAGQGRLHRLHLDTEQMIHASGIPFTFLRNAYYTELIRALGIREAAASGGLVSPRGKWIFNTADRRDLARAAAAVLTEDGHAGRTYELTAPKVWTLYDLARALSEATGRRVVYRADDAVQNEIYGLLALTDMRKVSTDLEQLAGGSLHTIKDEVEAVFGAGRASRT
ncbi:NAD(P)H-binding protein [Paenibacillus nasutitermitis]|uniref:NAD(P)-dependent oxidoreductase n=1 Tax=Paenibacillus nasutitermitis TaxID=1652958 RepID=A0A916ZGF3_9BACL|nr:NmrA family NAD(P)-binding protein [Paenibacillus nasutitermitis]GGD96207.1 NAD(P)-dependent oxidoreductase [Paenibacillus nasutitermitis]